MGDGRAGGFWDRVEPGHTTALIGAAGRIPGAPRLAWVVRARCDSPHRPLGPIFDARDLVAQLMGRPPLDMAAGRLRRGIRRHLLGDDPASDRDGELLADLDRLAEAGAGLAALVFESVDLADPSTLALLTRLARRPLRPALVLGFRGEPSRGPVRELLDAVLSVEGESRVIRAPSSGDLEERAELDPGRLAAPVRLVLRAASVIGDGFESALVARLLGLSQREVLMRLQEAADEGVSVDDLGDGRFRLEAGDAEALRQGLLPSLSAAWHRELAQILSGEEAPPNAASQQREPGVYAASQQTAARAAPQQTAADTAEDDDIPVAILSTPDLPLADSGAAADDGGVLLRQVQAAMHAAVEPETPREDPFATLARAAPAEQPSPPPARSARMTRTRADAEEEEGADPFARLAPAEASTAEAAPAPTPQEPTPPAAHAAPSDAAPSDADPFDALRPDAPPPAAAAPSPSPSPSPAGPWRAPRPAPDPVPVLDKAALRARLRGPPSVERQRQIAAVPGRAAQHLAAAGDPEAAIPRFVSAAREATAEGAYGTAEAYIERALALASLLPDTAARRALRARAHAELARVHWEGSGPRGFTLSLALAEADTALGLLLEHEEVALRAEVRGTIAAICYDLGDPASLERALSELTTATRELLAAGRAKVAARLLNDQAAVWVRLGDPVRAMHLLSESRRVFSGLQDASEEDRLELAETNHLLARLVLHVAARPGREAEALSAATEHAEQAAQVYRELGDRRELARVWETLGRLEQRRGALQRAWQHLSLAFEVQRALGDAVGLARSAGALAEVLTQAGRPADAIRFLGDSIQMNASKGSPIGLASNREGVEQLIGALTPEQRAQLEEPLAALTLALEEAAGRVRSAEAAHA